MTLARFRGSASAICLLVCLVGCSAEPVKNAGVIQFEDGQPVQSGSTEFRSVASGARYSSRIGSDGSFALCDKDGVPAFPPGEYEVVVVQIVITEDLAAADHQHGHTVPRRYADYFTSNLRFSNKADRTGPVEISLDLE